MTILTENTGPYKTASVRVGRTNPVYVGGHAPVVVQSMTNTDTADVTATLAQCIGLAEAGSELIRLTVDREESAAAVPLIKEKLVSAGYETPLIGDFHYNGHRLLNDYPDCASALDKYRINPGNVGFGGKKDKQFAMMIEAALVHNVPVRIGVNWGSLDQALLAELMDQNNLKAVPESAEAVLHEALILSALRSAEAAEALGLGRDKLILSVKVSSVPDLIALYRDLAKRSDYALHLGLTEAGMGREGIVASAVALAPLLCEGIGDTIRISLTPEPGGARTEEVHVAKAVLQSLGLRRFKPKVSACPGCGRTTSSYFQTLAMEVESGLETRMKRWRETHPGAERLKIAVMGCIVNGPGESRHADIGISLPGTGEQPVAPVFIDGEKAHTLRGDALSSQFMSIVDDYVDRRFGTKSSNVLSI